MVEIEIRKSNLIKGRFSAFVSFNDDLRVLRILKALPEKYYSDGIIEIPLDKVPVVERRVKGIEIPVTVIDNREDYELTSVELPEGFTFKTTPFEHQKQGVLFGLEHEKWFLGDEQGLGKSKQVIDIAIARKIKYGYKHCLIICGVNTLKWNWAAEVTKHSNEKAHILGQRVRKRSKKLYIGSMKDKIEDLKHIDELPYFIITNIESFRNKDFAELVKKLCNKDKISMSAADEMHKMKNPQGQQTKGFMKCLPEVQIGMTGTPLMNNPLDLYIILKWLGYENHTYGAFKNHYCIMGGFGGYEVIGYRNMNELSDKIRNIMLRRLKSDVLDLPEKTYIDEYLDMTDRQAIIYSEVKSDIKAHIDEIKFDNNPLSTLIRLRQATGYTGILSSEIKESVKLDRMVDIVDEAIANGDQVVIFSNWTKMTDVIAEHIKYPYSVITGQTGDNIRQQNVNDFQEGKSKVIIGTIGAMGTGLTLTAAHTVIFLDEPWNKALFDQAVDRVHRIGTNGTVTIYSLMCKDTIDERIHEIIYKKGAMSDAVIDGKIVGNKNAILTYLLD